MGTHRTDQVQKHHGLLPLSTTGDAACGRTKSLTRVFVKRAKMTQKHSTMIHNQVTVITSAKMHTLYQIVSLAKTPIPCTVERKTIR